ncbi:MAG TPA: translation initiation factor IF-3 [Candidatus Angelobacter sp.]|nr:translation initiation factor IF-3 [Candidatus Angelobacter sp.]
MHRKFSKKKSNIHRIKVNKEKNLHPINEHIYSKEVRLISEDGSGVFPILEALKIAKDQGLDLVEVDSVSRPPVCRILSYKKFLYDQKKKKKQLNRDKKRIIKEIRFGLQTSSHDLEFKIKNAERFLKSKERVKVSLFFKGRNILHKGKGEEMINRFVDVLSPFGRIEQAIRTEGKRMFIILSPK